MSSNDISLDKVHNSIGLICTLWVEIEVIVDVCIQHMATEDVLSTSKEGTSIYLMLHNMDLRQKADSLKALANLFFGDTPVFYEAERISNSINGKLRTIRNRAVHDRWKEMGDKIIQRKIGTKIKRKPGTAEIDIKLYEDLTHEDESLIDGYIKEFRDSINDLHGLFSRILNEKARRAVSGE